MIENKKTNTILTIVLWIFCIALFAPMVFIVINSFKTFSQVVMTPLSLPENWNLDNFREVIKKADYVRVFANTVYFAIVSLIIVIVFGSMAGYKLARMSNKASKIVTLIFMLAMMLPFPIIMVPLSTIAADLHISNNLTLISILNAGFSCSLSIIMYTKTVAGIPRELDESAQIDGCTGYRFFFAIIFPLLKPMTGTIAILYFIRYWNDLLLPLILITDKKKYTIPLSQLVFYNQFTQNRWNLLLASGLMALLPVIILYLFVQKTLIKGITEGAVKG